ncbi:hypothetical protein FJ651_08985 [Paucihalobacter ruber]|uniref:Uncharacterized protein n=1 Tax=Paucihalobacter ruber TaxID=2567861 RepID=A0A506PLS1_9FLAO|nr:hypothetical protein [Paucihalobacter ruber]TPV33220.1 hypothetical protein FJ651_08985 [Paucihalobacter ruber]
MKHLKYKGILDRNNYQTSAELDLIIQKMIKNNIIKPRSEAGSNDKYNLISFLHLNDSEYRICKSVTKEIYFYIKEIIEENISAAYEISMISYKLNGIFSKHDKIKFLNQYYFDTLPSDLWFASYDSNFSSIKFYPSSWQSYILMQIDVAETMIEMYLKEGNFDLIQLIFSNETNTSSTYPKIDGVLKLWKKFFIASKVLAFIREQQSYLNDKGHSPRELKCLQELIGENNFNEFIKELKKASFINESLIIHENFDYGHRLNSKQMAVAIAFYLRKKYKHLVDKDIRFYFNNQNLRKLMHNTFPNTPSYSRFSALIKEYEEADKFSNNELNEHLLAHSVIKLLRDLFKC